MYVAGVEVTLFTNSSSFLETPLSFPGNRHTYRLCVNFEP